MLLLLLVRSSHVLGSPRKELAGVKSSVVRWLKEAIGSVYILAGKRVPREMSSDLLWNRPVGQSLLLCQLSDLC